VIEDTLDRASDGEPDRDLPGLVDESFAVLAGMAG
jgi:hypothetical protein